MIVFDDASSDRTGAVVNRYREVTGHPIQLVTRPQSIGKTPALHCSAELQRSRTLAFSKPKYSSPLKNPALPLMQGDAIGTRR